MPGGKAFGSGSRVRFRDAKGRFIHSPGNTVRIFDQIGPRLSLGPAVTESAVEDVLEFYRDQVEQWMKESAPWEDQTGDARDGLTAEVERRGSEFSLYVYHTVDYGIWLEVRWNGRYAILTPAVEHWGPFLMHEMEAFG
jgi:hypothetical protein